MVKVKVVAVGKIKEKYYSDAITEYSKRLSRFCDFKIVEVKEENFNAEPSPSEIEEIKKTEALRIEKELTGYTVALCIEGEKYSSEKLAFLLEKVKDFSGLITFIIGGSYGLDDSIKKAVNQKLSFSDLTFPHTLFRVMLTEQIYRAFMINSNSKYHK